MSVWRDCLVVASFINADLLKVFGDSDWCANFNAAVKRLPIDVVYRSIKAAAPDDKLHAETQYILDYGMKFYPINEHGVDERIDYTYLDIPKDLRTLDERIEYYGHFSDTDTRHLKPEYLRKLVDDLLKERESLLKERKS